MNRTESGSWDEFVHNLCELAKSYGYILDEPVYSCWCGVGEYTAIIRHGDGRKYATVSVNDIDELAGEIEAALKSGKAQ